MSIRYIDLEKISIKLYVIPEYIYAQTYIYLNILNLNIYLGG